MKEGRKEGWKELLTTRSEELSNVYQPHILKDNKGVSLAVT